MILLVEDDNSIRETMTEILTDQGYQIQQATNGKEALEALRALGPDSPCVILLDLKMPIMDGKEFLEEIQKNQELRAKGIPIVITSASFELGKQKLPLVSKTLFKPYNLDDVLTTIEEFCA